MNSKVKKLANMGKDSIISTALKIIDEKQLTRDDFSSIEVITNGEEIYVLFLNPIKFLPKNIFFKGDITVNILANTTSYNTISNSNIGIIQSDSIPFYTRTKEAEKHIQFVISSINNSNKAGKIDPENFYKNMIIRELDGYYSIEVVSEVQESFYKVDMRSGNVFDWVHAHIEPNPFEDKTIWKKIKE